MDSQQTNTCLKSTIETLEKGLKNVQLTMKTQKRCEWCRPFSCL